MTAVAGLSSEVGHNDGPIVNAHIQVSTHLREQ
jgi:hypothetical protein